MLVCVCRLQTDVDPFGSGTGVLDQVLVCWIRHWCVGSGTGVLDQVLVCWIRHWCAAAALLDTSVQPEGGGGVVGPVYR